MMTSHNGKTASVANALRSLALLCVFVSYVRDVSASVGGVDAAVAAAAAAVDAADDKGFVSLKLTPRHVQMERLRRERRLSNHDEEAEDPEAEAETEPTATTNNDDYDEEQYRRRENAVQVGALFEGYGTHYVDLWCGTPPQRQTVIVDTGSGVTAFPCVGCKDCGVPDYHIDALFDESKSKTFETSTCSVGADCLMARSNCQGGTCKIGMSYAEGSRWNAYEAVDSCYVMGPHETPLLAKHPVQEGDDMNPKHAADLAFDMTFGCQTLVTGLFKTQLADGIMGMSNQPSTFWSQMFREGKMGDKQQFALCFSRPPIITKEGTEAGAMTMGGCDTRLHKTPMVFTPSFDKGRSSFFSVKVRKFMLRDGQYGESAKSSGTNPNQGIIALDVPEATINKGGIIVDSGTTDTYWNMGISSQFKDAFLKMSGVVHSNAPKTMTEEEVRALPTILLQLYSDDDTNEMHSEEGFPYIPGLAGAMDPQHMSDVILAIPPTHYMEYNSDKKKWTSRFYTTERQGSVLGANAMMGHDVFFDVEEKRIGWAESDCAYTETVRKEGYDFEITGNLKSKVESVHHDHSHNGENKPAQTPAAAAETTEGLTTLCASISSGHKCQQEDGCNWGFGKCSIAKGYSPPTDPPTLAPEEEDDEDGGSSDNAPSSSSSASTQSIGQQVDIALDQAREHQIEVGVALLVTALLLCCCCFCICGRKRNYKTAARGGGVTNPEATNIEMMSHNGRGDRFSDEPIENGNGGGSSSSSRHSNGSSKKSFRDNPDEEPEFDGDFA